MLSKTPSLSSLSPPLTSPAPLCCSMAKMLEEEDDDKSFYEDHFGTEIFEEGNDSEFTSEGEGP